MMTTRMISVAEQNDVELVAESLSGNRDAFGQIVARYQSLVCSLTYSATGNLGQSEDLAQETFITAWKHLRLLREPAKLRAWLAGIARNRVNNFHRREGREPSHKAESLEQISETQSPEPLPVERAISNEELAILWRSLERIPEIYREPLVLFYRENQSIETVAQSLELSEDAVKQRLSRGRKLLHEEVLAFIEGALEKTNPGKVFTLGVIAALPALTISAKAATIGVVAKTVTAGDSTSTLIKGALKITAWTKAKMTIVVGMGVLLAAGTATMVIKERSPVVITKPSWTNDPWQNLINTLDAAQNFAIEKDRREPGALDNSPYGVEKEVKEIDGIYEDFFKNTPSGTIIRQSPFNGNDRNGILWLSDGEIAGLAAPFSELLAIAFQTNGQAFSISRMVLPAGLPEDKFDYIVNMPDHGSENFQSEIKRQFGLVGRMETRETNVLLLKVKNPDALSLLSKSQSTITNYDLKTYWPRSATMPALQTTLEKDFFHEPVIDETGLAKPKAAFSGIFFVSLPRNSNDLNLVRKVLLDQLGLELVPSREPIEMLVVEKMKEGK